MVEMIPAFKPFMPEELGELLPILHSGALAYGKWAKEFESRIASFVGVENVLAVNTYNSAVLVTLSTLGLKPGDEVIASPVSCLASNQPFLVKGLTVVWADVDPFSGTLDPADVEKKITSRTKAIFHNHYCGYPGHIDEINAIGKKYGITIVDDCIEAFGSVYKEQMLGNCGTDVTIFSFQTVRLPNTIDGGAVIFNNKALHEKARLVRDYGIDRTRFRDENNEISAACDIPLEGYGALMSDVNAYIGCQQMPLIPELLEKQRKNGAKWIAVLEESFPQLTPLANRPDILPNFWIFSILSDEKLKMLKYFRESGYYATGVHINNNIYSAFGKPAILKGVSAFTDRHLALPSGWWFER